MKKTITLLLVVISFTTSTLVFYFIDDPEGPNLFVVSVLAIIIFLPLVSIYKLITMKSKRKK